MKESQADLLEERLAGLRARLQGADPAALAERTGAIRAASDPAGGEFRLELWNRPVILEYPRFVAREAASGEILSSHNQALLLYYFSTARGTPLEGRWISFADLPDGRFYAQAFQGYTGKELARAFGRDPQAFARAAERLGGRREPLGEAAYSFQALPRVPLLAVYWAGDEDFPPTCQVLFDASVRDYLPTDACAVLGSRLTRRLIERGMQP